MPNKLKRLLGSMGQQSAREKQQKIKTPIEPKVTERKRQQTAKQEWTTGVPSPPGRPRIELSSDRIVDCEETSITDEINISWDVPSDDGGYPITGYRVEMLDIQSGCWIEITFIEGYEPKCTLSNILYGIMYRFRVIATNDAGASQPGEASEPVVVDVPGVQIAPYFVQNLTDYIALEYERVEFRIRALGTPKPNLQWFKDDMEVFSSDRIELKDEEEGGVLVLKESRISDSGIIKCVASNNLGKALSSCQFSVEATPRLEIPEFYQEGLVFHRDEIIKIKIPYSAKPLPKVVWFFDEEPISSNGDDVLVETTDAHTSLMIQKAKRWHCGEFRVYAENENGEDACAIIVTVTSPPSPPGKPEIIDITDTRCTIKWNPPDDDGGAGIKQYVLEYYRDTWDVWLKAKATKGCQETVEDLIPGSRYIYRVKAENDYGVSDPSEESTPFDVSGMVTASSQERISNDHKIEEENVDSAQYEKDYWPPGKADILDRFLKVEPLMKDMRIPSMESDGLPSMASFDEPEPALEGEKASIISSEDRSLSNVSETEEVTEVEKSTVTVDLLSESFESTDPIRIQMENDEQYRSEESLTSLIPEDRKQALTEFEEALNEMIQETERSESPKYANLEGETEDPVDGKRRGRKSPSVQSTTDSIVSVIEMSKPVPNAGMADILPTPAISVTTHDEMIMSSLNSQDPRAPVPPCRKSKSRDSSSSPIRPRRSRSEQRNEEPVGSSLYEEIIRSSRGSSIAGSQTDLHQVDLEPSPHSQPISHQEVVTKLRMAKRESTGSPLIVGVGVGSTKTVKKASKPEPLALSRRSLSRERHPPLYPPMPTAAPGVSRATDLDEKRVQTSQFKPKPIQIATSPIPMNSAPENELDPPFRIAIPKYLPQWFLITYAYSFVLILIIIISNVNPDGKLFIHFTAFWSIILYFVLDEDMANVDPLEKVVERFVT